MSELQFSPVEVGDMSEIPPDAPEGQWITSQKVTVRSTQKDNLPMLVIDFKLEEALTDGNEAFVGSKVTKFLVVRGAADPYVKMFRQDLADLCSGLKIEVPRFTTLRSASDFDEFIAEVEGNRGVAYTKHKADKKTGEVRTEITFRAPRGSVTSIVSEDTAEEAAPKKRARR